MKKYFNLKMLPFFPLCAGLIGLLLRTILYATGIDEKGLIVTSHPLAVSLFVLTALVMAGLFLCIRNIAGASKYAALFPPSPAAAFGSMAAAVGILLTDTYELFIRQDFITIACFILGILAAVGLAFNGHCRLSGKQPSFLFHGLVTLYLMIHPLSQYRLWSSDPQLINHCFHLLASVFLMLAGYQRTALDAAMGSPKLYAFYSQAALFFCCISIHGDSWLFYLTMVIWTATNLCVLPKAESLPVQEDL